MAFIGPREDKMGIRELVGRYEDRLVRVSGKWLLSRRDYHVVAEELPQ